MRKQVFQSDHRFCPYPVVFRVRPGGYSGWSLDRSTHPIMPPAISSSFVLITFLRLDPHFPWSLVIQSARL
jgi:hypothetical protein